MTSGKNLQQKHDGRKMIGINRKTDGSACRRPPLPVGVHCSLPAGAQTTRRRELLLPPYPRSTRILPAFYSDRTRLLLSFYCGKRGKTARILDVQNAKSISTATAAAMHQGQELGARCQKSEWPSDRRLHRQSPKPTMNRTRKRMQKRKACQGVPNRARHDVSPVKSGTPADSRKCQSGTKRCQTVPRECQRRQIWHSPKSGLRKLL